MLGLLQEKEGEEEQLCRASGAGHGGHCREGPTKRGFCLGWLNTDRVLEKCEEQASTNIFCPQALNL